MHDGAASRQDEQVPHLCGVYEHGAGGVGDHVLGHGTARRERLGTHCRQEILKDYNSQAQQPPQLHFETSRKQIQPRAQVCRHQLLACQQFVGN